MKVQLLLMLAAWCVAGCDEPSGNSAADMDTLAAQLEQSKQNPAAEPAAPDVVSPAPPVDNQSIQQAMGEEAEHPAATAEGGRATAGTATVGEGGGYYSAIVGAHRHITTRVDDLAWKQAIQHYKATNGKMPKDHDEFMSGVIAGFGIELPPLEEGEEYLWDPSEGQFGELYVVRQNQ